MSDKTKGGLLVEAAKAVGTVAGKIASIGKSSPASATPQEKSTQPSSEVSGKLPAKNKSRLPRKVKKERKKATAKALAKN